MINQLYYNQHCYEMLAALRGGGRLPHTVIISGKAGSGKKTFARQLGSAYLCAAAGSTPCGSCCDCHLSLAGTHPDLESINGEGKSGAISVQTIRALKLKAQIKPNQAQRRGFILNHCELMQAAAQNALLKQIEEPAAGVFYILLCDNAGALLETIRSRAVIFSLAELSPQQCAEVVCSLNPQIPPQEALSAAALSGGSVGLSLAALDSAGGTGIFQDCKDILHCLAASDSYGLLKVLQPYEGNRANYLSLLHALKLMAVSHSRSGSTSLSRLPQIHDILDYAATACTQNVVLPLLSTVIAHRLTTV